MNAVHLRYCGAGEFRASTKFLERLCDRELVIGEASQWEQVQERSKKSHDHFFALVHEAWVNLPEHLVTEFPNETALRKFALIKTGYCTVHKTVMADNTEAIKHAAFLQGREEYALCEIVGNVVTVWTAESQRRKAMGKKKFQQSKDDVLTFLSELIGTDVATLKQAEAA